MTIQPVQPKTSSSTVSTHDRSSHSTTITALPPTIVPTPTQGFLLVPNQHSLPSSTQFIAGSNLFQKQPRLAYSIPPHSTPDMSQTLVVGGHVIKQDGK